jgi:hypothetical protein
VNWLLSHRFDRAALPLADRHYNRRKVGSPQFVPPGRCLVLKEETGRALWVTSWPFAEFVRHAWPGAWVNSLFRSEGAGIASSLILEAVAVTRSIWPTPRQGMISFVDPKKVPPGTSGSRRAGCGAWQMLPADMPEAQQLPALAA